MDNQQPPQPIDEVVAPEVRTRTGFRRQASTPAETDVILLAELKAAGIPTFEEAAGLEPGKYAEMLLDTSGEVKTSIRGSLHGWKFERAWYYWMASGPGIDVESAEELHADFGQEVRVAGHCGCPSPTEWYKGFAVGNYHVDTAEELDQDITKMRAEEEDDQSNHQPSQNPTV